jgi:hypothetical protein
MADCILIAFAIAAAWVLSLYLKPFGTCWRCGGRGNHAPQGPPQSARLPAVQGQEAPPADRLAHRPPRRPHGPRRAGPHPQGGRQMTIFIRTSGGGGIVLLVVLALLYGHGSGLNGTVAIILSRLLDVRSKPP